jgi:hypothetical protein
MSSKSKLSIKRPERVVSLCLDASLQAEWEKAEADLVAARAKPSQSMTGNADLPRLAQAVTDLEAAMLAEVVLFRLRAIPRSQWSAAIASHPAKADDAEDAQFGADRGAFFDEIIPASIVAVTRAGEPVDFDAEADWSDLADEMTDWQFSQFAEAVFVLNRGAVSVPFSRAASRVIQGSSETSK